MIKKKGLVISSLGLISSMNKNYDQAKKHFFESEKILVSALGEDHIEVADVQIKIVESFLKEFQENCSSTFPLHKVNACLLSALSNFKKKFDESHYKYKQSLTFLYLLEEIQKEKTF